MGCIEIGFINSYYSTHSERIGYHKRPFSICWYSKALRKDAAANTDEQNTNLVSDLVEPIKSGPSTFKIISTSLFLSKLNFLLCLWSFTFSSSKSSSKSLQVSKSYCPAKNSIALRSVLFCFLG